MKILRPLPHQALAVLALLAAMPVAAQPVDVTDDLGRPVRLARPASRIVSLAPHVTELLYAAGAGERVVGVSRFSDYPPQAQKLPQVGDSQAVDFDRLLALKPELVVVWLHTIAYRQAERIRALGIPVYNSDLKEIDDIAASAEKLGALAGTAPAARVWAGTYRARHQALAKKYAGLSPLKVFYQVSYRPMYTLNRDHLASKMIALCGGTNLFAQATLIAPVVSVESVLAMNPQVVLSGQSDSTKAEWKQDWQKWTEIDAVRAGNLFAVPSDFIHRPGSRALDGAQAVCEALDTARSRLTGTR